jgi:acetyl-CoA C-acetyltransferase
LKTGSAGIVVAGGAESMSRKEADQWALDSHCKAIQAMDTMDLIEIQEAFAAQTLADAKSMGFSTAHLEQKVNVNGSGISLEHPIGATGSMRLVTLIHEMMRRDVRCRLVTICGGGGLGICAVVERR